jgi:hypothetical protein
LQTEVDRLGTDAGVVEAAREELGDAKSDEKVYRVIDNPPLDGVLPESWLAGTLSALLQSPAGTGPTLPDPSTAPPDTTVASGG